MRIRPQEWVDRFKQFAGRDRGDVDWPLPVAIWQDGRGLSSREATPYAMFAHTVANPGAGNHWCYTWTPTTPSRALIVRLCHMAFSRETSTAIVGLQIAAAITKAATNAVIEVGDDNNVTVTANEITNANLPAISVFNWVAATDPPRFAYPEYFLEAVIAPGQVLEVMSRTQDDILHMSAGYYTLPIV